MVGQPQGTVTVDSAIHASWTQGVFTDGIGGQLVGDAVLVIVGHVSPLDSGSERRLLAVSEERRGYFGKIYTIIKEIHEAVLRGVMLKIFFVVRIVKDL